MSIKTIATHDGQFHNDEVFACAILSLVYYEGVSIVRTRDRRIIDSADIAVDVGWVYDSIHGRYDHHQNDGGHSFPGHTTPMAAAGMVWLGYGSGLCGSQDVAAAVYKSLFLEIDLQDNFGVDTSRIGPMIQFSTLNPSWNSDSNGDSEFLDAVEIAKAVISKEIARVKSGDTSEFMTSVEIFPAFAQNVNIRRRAKEAAYNIHQMSVYNSDSDVLVMPVFYPWKEFLIKAKGHHPYKLAIYPKKGYDDEYCISTIPKGGENYSGNIILLPEEWVDNIPDGSVFVHKERFIMGVKGKDRALELAKEAIKLAAIEEHIEIIKKYY